MEIEASLFELMKRDPKKFTNVTNGVTPRRWIHCSFPELSNLLTLYNDNKNDWLGELDILMDLPVKLAKNSKLRELRYIQLLI